MKLTEPRIFRYAELMIELNHLYFSVLTDKSELGFTRKLRSWSLSTRCMMNSMYALSHQVWLASGNPGTRRNAAAARMTSDEKCIWLHR